MPLAPPPPVAPNDIIEAKFFCMTSDQLGLSVCHFNVGPVVVGNVPPQAIADRLANYSAVLFQNLMPASAQFYGTGVKDISQTPPPVSTFSAMGRGAGLQPGILLPTQTSGLITWRTPFAGRKYRGRMYVPFPWVAADAGANDLPSIAYMFNLNALATALTTPIVVSSGPNNLTLNLAVYHRPKVGPPAVPQSADNVTSYTTLQLWATQRRRGDHGRKNLPPF